MAKRVLFIHRHGPYGSSAGREGLDAAFVAAAFDQEVSLLFLGDGVFLLAKGQSDALGLKDASASFASLPLYDVERIYVDAGALAQRGLRVEDMLMPVEVLDLPAIRALIEAQDVVLGF
ncbi:MAG: sulfurtransferase complex subunit TusC [Gammaproteobacteria bacterium]|nr:sulfurtransferase complex subunit TusC [Gammaproteobacteria bacterium]